jgi:2-polyprenyl-3-methyl-5-hydroxy-6-metoxy-1,4-benzoquinol methylase
MSENICDVVGATTLHSCLACGNDHLVPMLDLTDQPLANAFRDDITEYEPRWPLKVNMCTNCHHLQLTHAVDPALIYKHYLYVSGTSQTYLEYMEWYAKFVREQFGYWADKVLDIGCNDGSQLDAFKKLGFRTYGVDPAENLHPVSTGKGHNVACGFWNEEVANSFDCTFDVITSQNAFAHIPDPLSYLKLVKEKLANDGLMFISTSQADMVLNNEFDTIYHEHISFFNAKSMQALAERAGLFLIDTVKTPIHGVSYIFVLSKKPREQRMKNIIAMEDHLGLYTDEKYARWAANTLRLVADLKTFVELYRKKGYVIGGYGAAAKGNTLLNFSNTKLDFIVDDNPLKQGKFSPGMNIPVVSIDHLKTYSEADKILFVPLAWNFFAEIQKKIRLCRNNENDKFLKYFPKVEIE